MDDIQSWWEVPSIAHFCSLFRAAFNLLDFDIEELEEALLTDGAEDNGSSLLQELIVRLLCGCVPNGSDISGFNYQMYLRRLFRKKCKEFGIVNPFNSDTDFQFLPLRTKVEILSCLCDFRLEGEDVQDLLKNLEADSLRVEPLGQDENGASYWYFYGTRLYKETVTQKNSKKKKVQKNKGKHSSSLNINPDAAWQVVCYSADDWEMLAQSFDNSEHPAEKALHHTLAVDFLPEIPRLFAEKERLQMKRLMEYQPRRTSSRINKQKKEAETTKPTTEKPTPEKATLEKPATEKPAPEKSTPEKKKPVDKQNPSNSSSSRRKVIEKIYTSSEDEDEKPATPVKPVKYIEENSKESTVTKESKKSSASIVEEKKDDVDEGKVKKSKKNRKRGHESEEEDEEESESTRSSSKKLRSRHEESKKKHKTSGSHKSHHKKKPKVSSENESADELVKKHKKSQKSKSRHSSRNKQPESEVEEEEEEEEVATTKRKVRKSSPGPSKGAAPVAPVGRQTNNSLACATGLIFFEDATPSTKKKKAKSSEVFAQSEEDLQTGMYKILERLKTHPDAWPFKDAVEEEYAPRYYTIVRHPMDLQRMEDKLDSGRYLTFDDFKDDFKLIIANCRKYNGSENEYSEMAENLEAAFERASCRYLENEFSTDEDVAIEYAKRNAAEATKVESSTKSSKKKSKSSTSKSPEPAEEVEEEEEERHSSKHKRSKKKDKDGSKKSHRKHHHRKSTDKEDEPEESKEEKETDAGEGSSTFLPPPVGPYGRRKAGPPPPPKSEIDPKKSEKRKRRDSGDDEEEDETFSAGDVDRENKRRDLSSKVKALSKKRKGGSKNNAAIEALEIATEQTLKDINKWLDDTPRFSEFSSASNSPAHYIGSEEYPAGSSAIEREYRKSLRMDSEYLKRKKRRDLLSKDKRRREQQRTIDRLQPGKGKGNLIASIIKAKDEHSHDPQPQIKPIKDKGAPSVSKVGDNAPTLSLGSVLTGTGFGRHSFKKEEVPVEHDSEEKESEDEKPEETAETKTKTKEEVLEAKEEPKEPEETEKVDCNKATPNLSAWFKAFGAPKPAPPPKKKEEPAPSKAPEPKAKSPTPVVEAPPAPRQRNPSTGSSSISDLSSPFSQDPDMSPRDTHKATPNHQSPPMVSPTSPRTPFSSQVPANYPYNGSIKVGFYQEHKTSPEKSPREEPPPALMQTVKPPQATPPYSATSRHYTEQQMAHYNQQLPHQPPPPPVMMLEKPPAPQASPPAPVLQQPSYNQSSMRYDMSKPLTDQYREAVITHKPQSVPVPQLPPPVAHAASSPMLPDYYAKLNYGQPMPQPYKAPMLLPQSQPPPPDPKVMQQYPVKKRMVYAATEEERYSGMSDLYQQNQRLVAPPLQTYFDPTMPPVFPPYDLSTAMPKETAPAPPPKAKRGRKKAEKLVEKEPLVPTVPTPSSFPTFGGLGGLKPPPGVVPGSAFNFGPPPGLHLAYPQEFNYRNFKLKSPPPSQVATSQQAFSAASDTFHQAAYYHHQFTQAASLGTAVASASGGGPAPASAVSRPNYMMEQQLYQQYFQPRPDPGLLHQGLYAPPPNPYHPSLGIPRQPFDVNRPSWL